MRDVRAAKAFVEKHRKRRQSNKVLHGHPSPLHWAEQDVPMDAVLRARERTNREIPKRVNLYVGTPYCLPTDPDRCGFDPSTTEIYTASATTGTELHVGDIAVLRPGERLTVEPAIAALVFDVPDAPDENVPAAIRPDWDPDITDVLGGCATETGAYRRILLTWLKDNGPYTFHGLNAHRVRITDSFTHYHPADTGFDEFYLVQMSNDEDKVLTSYHAAAIESPETMTPDLAGQLFDVHEVRTGDLIYLPRGVIHRGLGGVLAQVITVPGFRPGTEIGVDHHLLAINERLGLEGEDALPYNVEASTEAVVR